MIIRSDNETFKHMQARRQKYQGPLDAIFRIPDQSVDLDSVHVIQLLQSHLNLSLVRFHVHNEDQSVVLLDLLHRTLSVQGVNDDLMVVKARLMRDRLARVLG